MVFRPVRVARPKGGAEICFDITSESSKFRGADFQPRDRPLSGFGFQQQKRFAADDFIFVVYDFTVVEIINFYVSRAESALKARNGDKRDQQYDPKSPVVLTMRLMGNRLQI